LRGGKVVILLAPAGTEQDEVTQPKKAVEDAGGQVEVVGIQGGEARAYNNDLDPGKTFTIEKAFSEASAEDYDAPILSGAPWGQTTFAAAIRR
jgi:protease I